MNASLPLKILVLTRYGRLGASSRVRFLQFLPALRCFGFDFDVCPFFSNKYIRTIYEGKTAKASSIASFYSRRLAALLNRGRYDLVWLEKEVLPWIPDWIERALLGRSRYVVDFDDAWFHRYDQHSSKWLRLVLGRKIDVVMRNASAVVAGNEYIADHAKNVGARKVVLIPSTVDLDRYPSNISSSLSSEEITTRPVIVGWIGTPVTVPYLASVEQAFRAVALDAPPILRVIGATPPNNFGGLPIESAPWTEPTEIQQILELDIGIMPLANTPWERGKCAYKLLQVMAAGRPVIASPVGANCQVIQHGINGFLANSTNEWTSALRSLISDQRLRYRLGLAARKTVELTYSTERVLPLLVETLNDAIQRKQAYQQHEVS